MRWQRPVPGSVLAVVTVVVVALVGVHIARQPAAGARAAQLTRLPPGTLSFAPGTTPLDRQAVLAAIAAARPDARRVIAAVDGLIDVRIGPTGASAVGLTQRVNGRYLVTLDLATVSRYGARGIARLVLHELGHVVDGALVDAALGARLDAQIPRGWGCDAGNRGACANMAERFAESFAKWATGDIGMNLYLGYAVPPPDSLDTWGEPLVGLIS